MRRTRAFTLVELLVVIGIIAILISILLPVLSGVRRQAAKAKCATQMRELGNAMVMYAHENKGYLPAPRISTPYNIDGILFDKGGPEVQGQSVDENAKWWHQLRKYVSKQTAMAQNAQEAGAMAAGIFWCPSWQGFMDGGNASNMQGDVNRNFTGIGMNWWPSLRVDYPASDLNSNGFPSGPRQVEKFADPTGGGPGPAKGTWYKLSQYTRPAERALLADSRYWYLEARLVKPGESIPGQRLNFYHRYSAGDVGRRQAMFDFYRHGKYPGVENGNPNNGYFKAVGGQLGYNILYADNHVSAPSDRETGYRAARMRFPG